MSQFIRRPHVTSTQVSGLSDQQSKKTDLIYNDKEQTFEKLKMENVWHFFLN